MHDERERFLIRYVGGFAGKGLGGFNGHKAL